MKRAAPAVAALFTLAACTDAPLVTAPAAPHVAFAASAARGGGAVTTRIPMRTVVFSPCSGESVIYEGAYHVVAHARTDGSTASHVVDQANFQGMTGFEPASGRRYNLVENDHRIENANGGASEFTDVTVFRVISQGATDNWWAQIVLHVTMNANGQATATVDHVDGGCHG